MKILHTMLAPLNLHSPFGSLFKFVGVIGITITNPDHCATSFVKMHYIIISIIVKIWCPRIAFLENVIIEHDIYVHCRLLMNYRPRGKRCILNNLTIYEGLYCCSWEKIVCRNSFDQITYHHVHISSSWNWHSRYFLMGIMVCWRIEHLLVSM